ncbi:putative holin [Klebsiella pneumoniae]|nr:putative holin [Klebsiella pneumoniae]
MLLLHEVRHQRCAQDHPCRCAAGRYRFHFARTARHQSYNKLSLVSIGAILATTLIEHCFLTQPGSYLIEDWKENLGKPVPVSRNEPEYPVATGYELIFSAVLLRCAPIVAAICFGVTMGL